MHQRHDKCGVLRFAMHAGAEICHGKNSPTISGGAKQVRVCQNTTWPDMSMRCVRMVQKANVSLCHMHLNLQF